jgi:hypothetical protein
MYHQVLMSPIAFDEAMKELPRLFKRIRTKSSKGVPARLALHFAKNPTAEVTSSELRERLRLKEISKRHLDRDLNDLIESQVLIAETTRKGVWGERGHPPRRYRVNPFLIREYMWTDEIDNETHRFFSLAEKFLSGTHALMDVTVHLLASSLETIEAGVSIPKIDERFTDLKRATFVIAEEIARVSILRSRIVLKDEDMPEPEAMRLGLLLGLSCGWAGVGGGNLTARVNSTDSTRGIPA